jgi:DNA mismatch endonuclease, patch repair protein
MQRQARKDTRQELEVRRRLHAKGIRYRVDTPPEPGMRVRADLVWRARRMAVFMDGCFWHGCPQHGTWPKANAEWWRTKIESNIARDRHTDERLRSGGWTVLRFWEHEDPVLVAAQIMAALGR